MNIRIYSLDAKLFIKGVLLFFTIVYQRGYFENAGRVMGGWVDIRIYKSIRKDRLRSEG